MTTEPLTIERSDRLAEASNRSSATRIASVDIIRGVVMVLMAIDHVRVYSGLPPGGPTPGIFFTRWITHFCAPAFVFLAGTSAFLLGRRLERRALARFLLIRGFWLILLELTVIRICWTFNFDFANYLLAGVIWAIGWSMIVLAGLVWLPLPAIAAIGAVVVAGHNLLDPVVRNLNPEGPPPFWLWQVLYLGGEFQVGAGGPPLVILYVLIPWVAVMALGYAFGAVLGWEPERRRRACYLIGFGAIGAFLVLRGFNLYGDPRHWEGSRMPAPLSFLNTTKYPASLQFLLMTLGPTIAAIPLLEHARGRIADFFVVFGRVPLFYYLLHIPLIHALALVVSLIRFGNVDPWLFTNHPMRNPPAPETYVWSLGLLYLVFAIAVAILYFPCRWFAGLKARSQAGWLSYL
jgi:uncharacterized membrane protein